MWSTMKSNASLYLQKVFVILFAIIIGNVLQPNAFGQQLAPIIIEYGKGGMPYGDGLHPGIDYLVAIGTPIVAVSDGIILFTGEPYKDKWYGGGFAVILKHSDNLFSFYYHMSKILVSNGQHIKRGQRIGLSGKSNSGFPHLHFELLKSTKKSSGSNISQTYNPHDFWLNGKPQCFDPHKDYSKNLITEITFPVECSLSR